MENTRRAILRGRALANEGFYDHAIETWKEMLKVAYDMHDYAGMFVLAVDIGEASVRLAMRSDPKALKLLKEAVENFDYALQIVSKCLLQDDLKKNQMLCNGVKHATILRTKAQQLMNNLRMEEPENKVWSCSTCATSGKKLVLDENDGRLYCNGCYEAYYATTEIAAASVGVVLENEDIIATSEWKNEQTANEINENSADDLARSRTSLELAIVKEKERPELFQTTSKHIDNEGKKDRVRYDRVELGSLANFLAGSTCLDHQAGDQRHNDVITVPTAIAAIEDELVEKVDSTTKDYDMELHYRTAALQMPVLAQAGISCDDYSDKLKYSIAQLLEIRESSPIDCPATVLASPCARAPF
ncbi:hypothetical protein CCR75_001410 [Bremia lactucae]|uniref:Uncharacterized protein n=1 Tax=Bremia lactucae TaxID=4779 RepID=A0A976FKT7_BRELC|nr:hypothetical protein CCR75_001410 [Bremia lactucae]